MSPLDIVFQRADKAWDALDLKSAFRLFLRAAKAGEIGCQNNRGMFCADRLGAKPNRDKAYWCRRAYRLIHRAAAANRFERAIALGDIDTNLDLAKVYLKRVENKKAIRHVERAGP